MTDPLPVSHYDPARIKKKVIFPILISLGSMAFIFSFTSFRGISLEEIEQTRFHFGFLGMALLLLVLTWMIDGLRVWLTARAWGKKIAFGNALSAVLSQYFMSSITPFMTGGSPAQLYVLARSGLGWGEASSLVVVCGILYQVSLLLLLFLFVFVFRVGFVLQGVLLGILYSFAVFYSVVMFLLFFFLYHPRALFRAVNWGIYFVRRYFRRAKFSEEAVRQWIEVFLEEFRQGFTILFRRKPQYLAWNLGCYMVNYTLIFSLAYLIIRALGSHPSLLRVIGVQIPLFYIFSFIPSPGASGGAEFSFASVFSGLVGFHRVGMFVLLWRSFTFYLPMLAGGVVFFRVLRGVGGR